jgi:hypothetical protein
VLVGEWQAPPGREQPGGPDEPMERELAAVRASVEAVGASLGACRSALLDLQLQLSQLERQLTRLEAAHGAPGGATGSGRGATGGDEAAGFGLAPAAAGAGDGDATIDRVERIRVASEALLKRPLRASERAIVLRWAQLERDGEQVPVEEILHVAGRLLTRRTADGTLPTGLAWCDATVQTLARGAVGVAPARGMDAAAEYAAMYERLADRLDAAAPSRPAPEEGP